MAHIPPPITLTQEPSFSSIISAALDSEDAERSTSSTVIEDEWKLPTPQALRGELLNKYTDADRTQAWANSAKIVKTHNDELMTRWKEEMDTLLVYAGLFSAVLTAFNVQSYQLLQQDPTVPTVKALQKISAQLNSFSVNANFVNSTQTPLTSEDLNPPFHPPASAVWINALWFSSLICSLASASIALMVKQWLHELSIGVSGTSRESRHIRQYRLNSLKRWHVGTIVIIIPILLQLALFLFLVGLVMLLWTLHGTVAAVATTLVGQLFIFVIITTFLPVFRVDCAYRSPQSLGIFMAIRAFRRSAMDLVVRAAQSAWSLTKHWKRRRGLLGKVSGAVWGVYVAVCLSTKENPTWHGREHIAVANAMDELDRDLAAVAYTTTFDAEYLEDLRPLLADMPWKHAVACYDDIFEARARLWGTSIARTQDGFSRHSFDILKILLAADHEERGADWHDAVIKILNSLTLPNDVADENVLRNLCILAMENTPSADKALLRIIMHLRDYEVGLDVCRSSEGLKAVMIMSEWRLRFPGGPDISTTLRHYLQSVEAILHCTLRAASSCHAPSSPPLCSEDRGHMHARAHRALASFRSFLHTSLWREPSLYICLGLSNIVPLLVDLARADATLVPPELVDALSAVWSAVSEGADADGERLRRVQGYIDWTGEVLEALRAVTDGRPVLSDQRPTLRRPRAQFGDSVKSPPPSPRFPWTRRRARLVSI